MVKFSTLIMRDGLRKYEQKKIYAKFLFYSIERMD